MSVGRVFQAKGLAIAKSWKKEGSWHVQGRAGRPIGLEQSELEGKEDTGRGGHRWLGPDHRGLVGHSKDGEVHVKHDGKPLRILKSREVDVLELNFHQGHPGAAWGRQLLGPFVPLSHIQAGRSRGNLKKEWKCRGETEHLHCTPSLFHSAKLQSDWGGRESTRWLDETSDWYQKGALRRYGSWCIS